MFTTVRDILGKALFAFVYGDTGCGKTKLITTLSKRDDGKDCCIITPEENGPTTLASFGFSDMPVVVLPSAGKDPFAPCFAALRQLGTMKGVTTIGLDGLTVMTGRAVDFLSDGEGEKALGFEGWQEILANFRGIEGECQKLVRMGKNVVLTAWESEPEYDQDTGQRKEWGRPFLQGKAKKWLPGNVDVIARMTSEFKKSDPVKVNGVVKAGPKKWTGSLQIQPGDGYIAKSRWAWLQSPYPPDLRKMLNEVVAFSNAKRVNLSATTTKEKTK